MKLGIMLWDQENCLDVHITGVHTIEVVTVCNREVSVASGWTKSFNTKKVRVLLSYLFLTL